MRPLAVPVTGVTALLLSLAMVFAFAGRASAAPTADFTYDVTAPVVAQPVTFTFTGACDVAPCRIRWTWFTTGGSALGTAMGEGPVLTYSFPAMNTYAVVAHITNATTTHGSASMTHFIAVGAVPSAPPNVTAVSAAHNQVTVAWNAPEQTGGELVTSYQVTVEDGNPNSVASVPAADLTATLLNIKAGTFGVSVTAVNSHGGSAAGTASVTVADEPPPVVIEPPVVVVAPAVVAAPPATPGAPLATAVKPGGVTTVRWTAPAPMNGAPVHRYLVTVDGRLTVVKNATTSLTVRGLRAGPAKILVRAQNSFGVSKAAATRIVVPRSVARAPKATLQLGMHGAAVKRLQIALQMRRRSGEFGGSTRAAVLDFQTAHALDRTGKANDRMRYLLAV
jgi:hypothetical protein